MPFLIILAAAVSCRAQTTESAGSISIENMGTGAIPLVGPWKFQTGDDPAWATPAFDDSGWESIRGDHPWGQQGHARYTGYAWYRIHLTFQTAPSTPRQFSLLVPRVYDVYQIFWNGELVGKEGRTPPWPVWYVSQQPKAFHFSSTGSGVLAIRIWKAPLFSDDSGELGGLDGAPVVGSAEAINGAKAIIDYQWLHSRQLQFAEQLIYALIAMLSFLVWWWNRSQRLLLWMSSYALTPLIVVLLLDAHLGLPYFVAMGSTQPANCLHDVSLWFLLLWLLHLSKDRVLPRLVKVLAIVSLSVTSLDGLLLALAWHRDWTVRVQELDAAITAISTLIQALPLVLVTLAIQRRNRLKFSSWLVAALAILDGMFVAVLDALKQGQRFTGWTIGNQLADPFLSINGNAVSLAMIIRGLLLVAIVTAVYTSYREERQREMLLANEFSNARELQRMLIPENQHSTPGFAISSSYLPALEVGGDFFQLFPLAGDSNGTTLLLLGDVSGHGLKAALSVSYIVGIMRVLAEVFPEPGPLLTELNHRLCGHMDNGFATCIAVKIDRFGACTLSSAGHPPPFLNWQALEVPGAVPLGLDVTASYDQITLQCNPGDHLALYTDGLLEARNKTGELYGFERLRKLFAANPSAPEAAEAAVRFGQDDDVTVVTLAYTGESGPAVGEPNCEPPRAVMLEGRGN
jgi:hypothetical protein